MNNLPAQLPMGHLVGGNQWLLAKATNSGWKRAGVSGSGAVVLAVVAELARGLSVAHTSRKARCMLSLPAVQAICGVCICPLLPPEVETGDLQVSGQSGLHSECCGPPGLHRETTF